MPSIIFESFGSDDSIELDLTKASEKEIKEAFIKSSCNFICSCNLFKSCMINF